VSPEKEQIVLYNPEDRSLRVQRARSQSLSAFTQRLPPSILHSSSTSSSASASISPPSSSSSSSSTKSSPTSRRSSVSSSVSSSSSSSSSNSLSHTCPVCLRSFSTSEMTTRYFALLQTLLPSSQSSSPTSASSSSSTPTSESASSTSSSTSSSPSSSSFPLGGDEASFRGLFNTGIFLPSHSFLLSTLTLTLTFPSPSPSSAPLSHFPLSRSSPQDTSSDSSWKIARLAQVDSGQYFNVDTFSMVWI
jgi:DNA mismatch repair ATPase MutL